MSRLFRWWSQAFNAERFAIVVGFGLTICGLLGAQFYLEPAQQQRSDIQEQLGAARSKAQILRAANALDNIFGQLGAMIFTLNGNDQPDQASADAVHTLQKRALDWRHDGVRTYLAQLGIAGEIDFKPVSAAYEALVDDERRQGSFEAYTKVNQFEADLAMASVTNSGTAAMQAIQLHSKILSAEAEVWYRSIVLLVITLSGSTLVLIATLLADRQAPPRPRPDSAEPISPISDIEATIAALRLAQAQLARMLAQANAGASTSAPGTEA